MKQWMFDRSYHSFRLEIAFEAEIRVDSSQPKVERRQNLVGEVERTVAIDIELGTVEQHQVGVSLPQLLYLAPLTKQCRLVETAKSQTTTMVGDRHVFPAKSPDACDNRGQALATVRRPVAVDVEVAPKLGVVT